MDLVEADDLQKQARDGLTYQAWGKGLTPEQYAAREVRLRRHPWARDAMRTWLLVGDGGEVLSSCETFRMDARVRRGDAALSGLAYGIASVFTEPRLRGHRYAQAMLERLHPRLRALHPSGLAAVLYSDVGGPIYARAGYVARPAFDFVFPSEPGDPADGVDALVKETELEGALALVPEPADPFVIPPSVAQVDWQLERERCYAGFLGVPRPSSAGARVGRSVMLWATSGRRDFNVLLMHAEGPREASLLMRSARRMAARVGVAAVRLWEEPRPFPWPLPEDGGRREPRDGSLPMLCPLEPAVRPEDWRAIPRALWL